MYGSLYRAFQKITSVPNDTAAAKSPLVSARTPAPPAAGASCGAVPERKKNQRFPPVFRVKYTCPHCRKIPRSHTAPARIRTCPAYLRKAARPRPKAARRLSPYHLQNRKRGSGCWRQSRPGGRNGAFDAAGKRYVQRLRRVFPRILPEDGKPIIIAAGRIHPALHIFCIENETAGSQHAT